MKSELYTAIAELAAERNMPREVIVGAVEHALKDALQEDARHRRRRQCARDL